MQDVFVGGLRLPGDETGDAYLFTQRLAALCAELGVTFRYGTLIARLRQEEGGLSLLRLTTARC